MQPAQRSLGDVEAAVAAAAPEASRYVPDRLRDVRRRVDGMQASYDRRDYAAVLAAAPAAMSAAHSLAVAAAAKKGELLLAQSGQWEGLAADVSRYTDAILQRIERPVGRSGQKPAVDMSAARGALSDARSLWSKAQAAFAIGNLDEAVATAETVKGRLRALAEQLNVNLPAAR
jgi:hypothetical protein